MKAHREWRMKDGYGKWTYGRLWRYRSGLHMENKRKQMMIPKFVPLKPDGMGIERRTE